MPRHPALEEYKSAYEELTQINGKLINRISDVAETLGIDDKSSKQRLLQALNHFDEIDKQMEADDQIFTELAQVEDDEKSKLADLYKQKSRKLKKSELAGIYGEKVRPIMGKLTHELQQPSTAAADDDVEMEVTSMTYSRKDPITKKDIENPYKNKICQHVYDKGSIQDYITQNKAHRRLCQCPIPSCPNKKALVMEDLMPFPEFFNLINQQ
uniref:E3 SUMO-protein ligase NSE2 n=1 Tax=Acrobeloides nanus TaxID=290746 RepID=A0A914CQZ4_9BILA